MIVNICECGCGGEVEKGNRFISGHQQIGRKRTDESKLKMRLSRLGKTPGNFNGGSWHYWRRHALIRDDYTCQICGFRNMDIMIVDHKLPKSKYPELKLNLDNLQTLCPNCNQIKTIRELKNKEYR